MDNLNKYHLLDKEISTVAYGFNGGTGTSRFSISFSSEITLISISRSDVLMNVFVGERAHVNQVQTSTVATVGYV